MKKFRQPHYLARIARKLRLFRGFPGWHRIITWLVPAHDCDFCIRNSDTLFCGNIESYIDSQIYLFGGYEQNLIKTFLNEIPADRRGKVLDIGANVGNHSLEFSRAFNSVESFEPNPMLWAQFEKNIKLNNIMNVNLHKVGLSDFDSELILYMIDKPNHGLGTFSTVEQYDLPIKATSKCTVHNGSKFLSEIGVGQVDAVKIDVQGFEPEVMKGLYEVLLRDKPIIWFEIGEGTIKKIDTYSKLKNFIPFDFRLFRMDEKLKMTKSIVNLIECTGSLISSDYLIIPIR